MGSQSEGTGADAPVAATAVQAAGVSSRARPTRIGVLAAITAVLLGALALVDYDLRARAARENQDALNRTGEDVRARLTADMRERVATVADLSAFMLAHDELPDGRAFDNYCAAVIESHPSIRGLAYVDPQRVIRHFYPLAGNESAVGLDLSTRPAAPFVERAIAQRRLVVADPFKTVQGSLSIIARAPLYRDDRLLGLVQGVFDVSSIVEDIEGALKGRFSIEIRDDAGRTFWGASIADTQAWRGTVDVGDNQWEIRVAWRDSPPVVDASLRAILWFCGLALTAALLYMLQRGFSYTGRLESAVHQRTVALENGNARLRREIRERRRAEVELRESEDNLRRLAENANDGIMVAVGSRLVFGNQRLGQMAGYEPAELMAVSVDELFDNAAVGRLAGQDAVGISVQATSGNREDALVHKDGRRVPVELTVAPSVWLGESSTIIVVRDIAERKARQQELEHLALHDPLTGLANRTLFYDRLEHAITRAKREHTVLAVLVMDLDRFKEINDTLGHAAGDDVLCAVARRFRETLRDSDTIARLGGDEFAVLLPGIDAAEAELVAAKLLNRLYENFEHDGVLLDVQCSVGIVGFPDHGDLASVLIQRADVAMYQAKNRGLAAARYDAEQDSNSIRRLQLVSGLRRAIALREIEIVYQPKVDCETGRGVGVEALARWEHPELGRVPPAEFVEVAEHIGLSSSLTLVVLNKVFRQLGSWRAEGAVVQSAINLSVPDVQSSDLPNVVAGLLAAWGVDASQVIFEIAEQSLMTDPGQALQVVQRLHEMGIEISIDDFGVGYSSMAYLKDLPVDELKIDRSFVSAMLTDNKNAMIVRAVADLAHNMGLRVVAEGVEGDDVWTALRELNCDHAQGFLWSRPLSPADALAFLTGDAAAAPSTAARGARGAAGSSG